MITGSKVIDYENALEKGFKLLKVEKTRKLGFLIVCGVNFGLRISDLRRITFDQLKSGKFVVGEKKTGKKRVIVVNDTVRKAMEYFCDTPEYELGGQVFRGQKDSIWSSQHINRSLKKVFGEGYSSHGLRKGFGRRVYEKKKKDLSIVQLVLQHSNPADTLRYIGVTQEDIEKTYTDIL